MFKGKISLSLLVFLVALIYCVPALAQQPPASQTVGGVTRQEKGIQDQKRLEEKIEGKKPSTGELTVEDINTQDLGPKVLVNTITVEGAVLLSDREIRAIVSQYEGRELSLKAMQKIADLVTDAYRKKGYVTSRAYLPPQNIQGGALLIRVVEGKLGTLDIKGNKHFSTKLLRNKIDIRPDGYFDYSALQRSLIYINEHPDRTAKAILVPGTQPGTTDIVIEVEDRAPFHVKLSYDNYGSRYINKNRYAITLEHTNLTGHDDKVNVKGQFSDNSHLLLQQARYVYPITQEFDLGGYILFSQIDLGEEFEALDSEGEAEIYGIFSSYDAIAEDELGVVLNLGFDLKKITNELAGVQLSRDQHSIVKAGVDVDLSDVWGRTILTAEVDQGIPNFLGSMDDKDADASRTGAGGKFTKGVFNLFRLQPMPYSTTLLLKNSFQFTNNNLTASEQFQIGGATSVRGYPPGEFSGDKGFYSAVELSFPCYGLSKDLKVPFRKENLYDVLRFVAFWDIGRVSYTNAQPGETKSQTLRSAGAGMRLTVAEELEIRVEIGYPLGGPTPSDGDHAHTWVEFHWKF